MTRTQAAPAPQAADALLKLTDQLRRVMAEEISVHRKGRPREAEPLIAEKARLAAEYHALARHLQQDPAWLSDPEQAPQRARVKEALETLQAELQAHSRSIQRYRLLTEGVVRAAAEEIERRRRPFKGYGRAAARGPADTSLAVDQRL